MYNGKMNENKEKLKQQLWNMNQKLSKDHIKIAGKHILLQGMQLKIEQLKEEIIHYRSQESCKILESNKIMTRSDLILENANLKKKMKDLEHDQISFNLEILEAVEEVKQQILSEKKAKAYQHVNESSADFEKDKKTLYGQRISELEEQVRDAKEMIRKFNNAGQGFEHFMIENDPAGPNCKCLIC